MVSGTEPDYDFERDISKLRPEEARLWGFRSGTGGILMSRTIMLQDLSELLRTVPEGAAVAAYANALVAENCLAKPTVTARKKSLGYLRQLYALDDQVVLFRVFRELWKRDVNSRPLLGVLLAMARDPLLRATFAAVAGTLIGASLRLQSIRDIIVKALNRRLAASTAAATVARTSSSWAQSGHLVNARSKVRQRVEPTPVTAAFALLIGYILGHRGHLMFETPWMDVLDAGPASLMDQAQQAHRLGLLNLRSTGDVVEVSFACLLTDAEMERIHGLH